MTSALDKPSNTIFETPEQTLKFLRSVRITLEAKAQERINKFAELLDLNEASFRDKSRERRGNAVQVDNFLETLINMRFSSDGELEQGMSYLGEAAVILTEMDYLLRNPGSNKEFLIENKNSLVLTYTNTISSFDLWLQGVTGRILPVQNNPAQLDSNIPET